MPQFARPAEYWLSDHLKKTANAAKTAGQQGTEYITNGSLECVAIIGNIATYPVNGETKPTGLSGFGIAVLVGGIWQTASPPLVSALPSSPVDGQEVRYQNTAMAAIGAVWSLRYRAASTNAHKWEFAGGSPLATPIYGQVGPIKFTGAEVKAMGAESERPVLTVPLTGSYMFSWGASLLGNKAGNYIAAQLQNQGGGLIGNSQCQVQVAGQWQAPYGSPAAHSLVAGEVWKLVIWQQTEPMEIYNAYAQMSLTPVMVG